MKALRSIRREPVGIPVQPGATEQESRRPEATMQTDAHILRKAGGRLSREDQRRLGDILQRVYDDVIRQGVPERFRDLLNELGDEQAGGSEAPPAHGQSENGGLGQS